MLCIPDTLTSYELGAPIPKAVQDFVIKHFILPMLLKYDGGRALPDHEKQMILVEYAEDCVGFAPEAYRLAIKLMGRDRHKGNWRPDPGECREWLQKAEDEISARAGKPRQVRDQDELRRAMLGALCGVHGETMKAEEWSSGSFVGKRMRTDYITFPNVWDRARLGPMPSEKGCRLLAVAGGILRSLPKLFLWSIAIEAGLSIIENWENVSTRLKAIWDDLKQAAPAWAGGQGQGWGAFAQGPAMSQAGRELEGYLTANERGAQDWLRGTALGQWLIRNGWAMSDQQMAHNRLVQDYRGMGIDLPGLEADARMRAVVPDAGRPTVSMGPVTISTTINVAANASPQAIGAAAGDAIGSALRGVMGDVPATP